MDSFGQRLVTSRMTVADVLRELRELIAADERYAALALVDEIGERCAELERDARRERKVAEARSRGGRARAEAIRTDLYRREWALAVDDKLKRCPHLSAAEARRQVATEYGTTEHRVRRAHEQLRKSGRC